MFTLRQAGPLIVKDVCQVCYEEINFVNVINFVVSFLFARQIVNYFRISYFRLLIRISFSPNCEYLQNNFNEINCNLNAEGAE